METVEAPVLVRDESQALYDTVLNGQPAIIKYFRPENSRAASDLLSGLEAAQHLSHPNLIAVLQSGETELAGKNVVYAVMEKADDNLAAVLRHRPLDTDEMREVLDGILPALEFLHAKGFVHSRIKPSNVLACGDRVKLSSDRLRSTALPRAVIEPRGLYAAPETGGGQFTPASDVYSVAVLVLEALTGSPLENGISRLPSPFREIVAGGMERNPKTRWTLYRMREALHPESARPVPFASVKPYVEKRRKAKKERQEKPKYRKIGAMAIAGAVVAGSVCALLVRSAHEAPPPPATPAPMSKVVKPSPPILKPVAIEQPGLAVEQPTEAASRGFWAVVGAAYRRQADAENRAQAFRKKNPALNAVVYPTWAGARRYLVLFGRGASHEEAKKIAAVARRSGAPRNVYVTLLR